MNEEYLNVKQVAEKLGIKPVTVYKYLNYLKTLLIANLFVHAVMVV